MVSDIRFAVRMMARHRLFTAVALTVLALGIGANAAIFTVVNPLLLRPLPFHDPERLTVISAIRTQDAQTALPLSLPEFFDVREQGLQDLAFDGMSAWALGRFNLAGDEPESVQYAATTSDLFSVLGVAPALGRRFVADDDRPGAPAVAILSASLWRRRFGSTPSVVGASVTFDGRRFQVVGVMPPAFRFLNYQQDTEVWLPLGSDLFADRRYARGVRQMGVVGRL